MIFVRQPDGISCGPSCAAMVHMALLPAGAEPLDVDRIGSMCGTNPRTGTTHEGIAVSFAGLGIRSDRTFGREAAAQALRQGLDDGGTVLCRTLTFGVKHWVVAWGRVGDRISVADPWLGPVEMSEAELLDRTAPREHEVWRIPGRQKVREVRVRSLAEEPGLEDGAMALVAGAFGRYMPDGLRPFVESKTDRDASRIVVVDGTVRGVYLLRPCPLPETVDEGNRSIVAGLEGAEGVALAVDPAFRGCGYGRILKDEPERAGFGFVWGEQLKELDNLADWTRRRQLLGEKEDSWVTGEVFGGAFVPAPDSAASIVPGL